MPQHLNVHTEDWKSESRKESEDGSIEGKGLKERLADSDDIILRISMRIQPCGQRICCLVVLGFFSSSRPR